MALVSRTLRAGKTCGELAAMVLAAGVLMAVRRGEPDWAPYEY